ncbi:hypothetical protein HS1genome_1929 [Sulfodiicoccus acidiphilus]|uniref:Uncharacterized protein n=1 Tax=Sulfodiicoccus acidiphilus TaxID=1670455 RepID=A0A348B5T8_9CREN|nr:hypothetical protein [Sulfodiicoccus acidiphilus]BBD73540.1 hypothetical protein HS1genome_1929 [Sulfodiicoccus acidiphilus]GGT92437.1 hypothetical protein GCM10007116_07720 [Sulfodiicoccus acidiphilus]
MLERATEVNVKDDGEQAYKNQGVGERTTNDEGSKVGKVGSPSSEGGDLVVVKEPYFVVGTRTQGWEMFV